MLHIHEGEYGNATVLRTQITDEGRERWLSHID